MSYTPYRVLALIPSEMDLDFATVIEAVRAKFSRQTSPPQIDHAADMCTLRRGDWSFRFYWEASPHVLMESQDIAERAAAQGFDESTVAACARRISTAGDPDPDMLHFNDYVYVLEVLEGFKGIYLFDPYDGKFITERKQ